MEANISIIENVLNEFSPFQDFANPEAQAKTIYIAYQNFRKKESTLRGNLKLMDLRLQDIVMPIKSLN